MATQMEIVIMTLMTAILVPAELADRVRTMSDPTHALATLDTLEVTAMIQTTVTM